MTEEEKKKQQQTQGDTGNKGTGNVQNANDALVKEAERLEEYSKSPVKVDTQGQTRPWDEFLNNKVAQRLTETPEQQAAREKRERTERRLAALSDGLVALSNVTGAMFGATPVKQTATMSAAHNKNVKEAMERRRLNARQYEIARNNAMKLQQKQDEDNAKRYNDEVETRRKAGEKAAGIRQGLGKQAQAQTNADRNYNLAKKRLALAQQKEGRLAGGDGGSGGGTSKGGKKAFTPEHTRAAWDEWWRYTDEQRDEWRSRFGNRGRKLKDDDNFVNAVKQMHDSWKGTTTKHVPARQSKVNVKGSKKGGGYAGKFK